MEEKIRARLLARLDIEGEISDERLFEMIDEEIIREGGREGLPLDRRLFLRKTLFNSLRRLDILQEFLRTRPSRRSW